MNNPIITASGPIPAYACVKVSTSGSERVEVAASAADVVFGVTLAANTESGGAVNFQTTDSQLDIFTLKAAGNIAIGQYVVPTTNGTVTGATTGPFVALEAAILNQTFTARKFNAGATANYLAPGTGAITRTLDSKLGEVRSVKDFGAVGDGTTDDTVAINTAIDAALAGDGTLFFPSGVYAMSSQIVSTPISGVPNNVAQIGTKTLTKNLILKGDKATIKCTRATEIVYMFYFSANNFGVRLEGLTFDHNQKAWVGFRIEDTAAPTGFGTKTNEVIVDNCIFENSFKSTLSLNDWTTNAGLVVVGGYRHVKITNTTSRNHTRAADTNTPLSSSTLGFLITQDFGNPINAFPQNILIDSCHIENITNGNTNRDDQNLDTDGISMFGGFTDSAKFTPCKATVTNNTFINCKGRALKFQSDEIIVTNNQTRLNINPCGTGVPVTGFTIGSMFDIQGTTGNISNNIFHYEQPNGTGNPFSPTNTPGDIGGVAIAIGFSGVSTPGALTTRPKSFIVDNNTVYNNVPEGTGKLAVFLQAGESVNLLNFGAAATPGFLSVKGNRVLGGTVEDFMQLGLRSTAANSSTVPGAANQTNGIMYVNMIDNFASKMGQSFMSCGSNVNYLNNFMTFIGNVNASGSPVRHLINSSSPTVIQEAQITALGNVGIGQDAAKSGDTTTSMITRVDGIASVNTQEGPFGAMTIQTANIPGATGSIRSHTFPLKSVNIQGFTCLLIGNNMNALMNCMFTTTNTGLVSNFNTGNAVFPASGPTPPAPASFQVAIGQTALNGPVKIDIGTGWAANSKFTLFTFG